MKIYVGDIPFCIGFWREENGLIVKIIKKEFQGLKICDYDGVFMAFSLTLYLVSLLVFLIRSSFWAVNLFSTSNQ